MIGPRKYGDTQRAAVLDMARAGIRPALIAEAVPDVSMATIYTLISKARRAGADIPVFPAVRRTHRKGMPCTIKIDLGNYCHKDALSLAARRRGITETRLVKQLLDVIFSDGMIDCILDDGVRSEVDDECCEEAAS